MIVKVLAITMNQLFMIEIKLIDRIIHVRNLVGQSTIPLMIKAVFKGHRRMKILGINLKVMIHRVKRISAKIEKGSIIDNIKIIIRIKVNKIKVRRAES